MVKMPPYAFEVFASMKAKWLFFDLDGTLTDSVPGIRASIVEALASGGRTLRVDDVRPYIGPGIRATLRGLEPELTEADLDGMERCFRASYDSHGVMKSSLFPGVKQTLEALQAGGAELFVVTNKPHDPTAKFLLGNKMTGLFRQSLSRNSRDPPYASKGAMLQELVERHRVDVRHAMMVGDTAEDLEASLAAGMPFAFVEYGYGKLSKDAVCNRVARFADLATLCGQC